MNSDRLLGMTEVDLFFLIPPFPPMDTFPKLESAINWLKWLTQFCDYTTDEISKYITEGSVNDKKYSPEMREDYRWRLEQHSLQYLKLTVSSRVKDFIYSLDVKTAPAIFQALKKKYGHLSSEQAQMLTTEVFSMVQKIKTHKQAERFYDITRLLTENTENRFIPDFYICALAPHLRDAVYKKIRNYGGKKEFDEVDIQGIIYDVLEASSRK